MYDKDYYERGIETGKSLYSNFRWIPELTIPLAFRMIEYLGIKKEDTILDYGCAKGYLVRAFRLLGREAYGCDISKYALSSAPDDVKRYLVYADPDGPLESWRFDITISKDVLEHVPLKDLKETLKLIRLFSLNLFVIVPLGRNGKYIIPAYELDTTHQIRENMSWWQERISEAGFEITDSTYLVDGIKDNWSKWSDGNAFIRARAK